MTPERWHQIDRLLEAAMEREPAKRAAFLAEACADDDALRREIESLLEAHDQARSFIEAPPPAANEFFADGQARGMVGRILGHYQILEVLGAGGMGEVYRAVDTRLGRNVAVKISAQQFSGRFEREARAISTLNHPHICTLHDIGPNYLVMEFLEGETLAARLRNGPLPADQMLRYGSEIADALAEAHSKGIIHRDLKPSNLMITSFGIKVLDFGLAKFEGLVEAQPLADATTGHVILGTPAYMSPEQVRGETLGHASDIFSLGSVLYEMATGNPPFSRGSPAETMAAILKETPPRITGSPQLDQIVSRCLAKEAAERFSTASEVASALRLPFEHPTTRKRPQTFESIAVLPFINAGGDPATDYLCDGITESLINNLSQIPKLRVVPRSTVFRYKGTEITLARAAHELNVRTLLTGRILQRGDTLMIQTELVDGAADSQLWGQKYSRKLSDLVAVEEEIASQIANSLRIKLNPAEKKRLSRRSTQDPVAYQLYLKGRHLWNKRTRDALERAIEYFQQAISRDPAYALAHAGLADCFAMLGGFAFWAPQEAFPRARAQAQRAIEIDERLAEAHCSLALAYMYFDKDRENANREYRRAIALNRNYAVAHQGYGAHLCWMADFQQGIAELREAQQLEPLSPMINVQLGVGFYCARRYAEAAQVLQEVIALEPAFWPAHMFLGMVGVQQFDSDLAIMAIERAVEVSGRNSYTLAALGHALGQAGKRRQARDLLEELRTRSRSEYVAPYHLALIHLSLGEEELALDRLEQDAAEHSPFGMWMQVEPRLDPLRSNARFQAVLQNMFNRAAVGSGRKGPK